MAQKILLVWMLVSHVYGLKLAIHNWCKKINRNNRVRSTVTKDKHKKLHTETVDCETSNIIYLMTCNDCHKQYVGETKRSFRTRLSEHDRDVRLKKDTNVARHFNNNNHNWQLCRFDILEHLLGNPEIQNAHRLNRETYWIATLKTLSPSGINVMIGRQF